MRFLLVHVLSWGHVFDEEPLQRTRPTQQKAPADAVESLLTDHIQPKLKTLPLSPRDLFRDDRMHRIAPNRVLERNKTTLRAVFARYSAGGKGRHMNMDGWLSLLTDANLFDEGAVSLDPSTLTLPLLRPYPFHVSVILPNPSPALTLPRTPPNRSPNFFFIRVS